MLDRHPKFTPYRGLCKRALTHSKSSKTLPRTRNPVKGPCACHFLALYEAEAGYEAYFVALGDCVRMA